MDKSVDRFVVWAFVICCLFACPWAGANVCFCLRGLVGDEDVFDLASCYSL